MAYPNLRHNDFSVLVSNTMDALGHNRSMTDERMKYSRACVEFSNKMPIYRWIELIVSGSKGEGLTSRFESDLDLMLSTKDAICIENTRNCPDFRFSNVFQLNPENTSPGYTRLRMVHCVSKANKLLSEGTLYLSHEKLINYVLAERNLTAFRLPRSGPSLPLRILDMSFDVVYAMPCYSPSVLNAWLTRPRQYNWPPRDILDKISTLQAHVVPVGFKGSHRPSEEWRICYTKAELALVHSFTDSQIKVYVLLKYLAKDVFSNEFDVMTSYIMKNVIFWVSEITPPTVLTERALIDMLERSLRLLCVFITRGFCPNYMIPKRNIFSGKLHAGLRKNCCQEPEN